MSKISTLMIVDDSKSNRMLLQKQLKRSHPEWRIVEASSGVEALKNSNSEDIDFFIVDYSMPDMDGLMLIEQLSARPESSAKYALFTANIQDTLKDRAEKQGVICFHKPATLKVIEEIMQYLENND